MGLSVDEKKAFLEQLKSEDPSLYKVALDKWEEVAPLAEQYVHGEIDLNKLRSELAEDHQRFVSLRGEGTPRGALAIFSKPDLSFGLDSETRKKVAQFDKLILQHIIPHKIGVDDRTVPYKQFESFAGDVLA